MNHITKMLFLITFMISGSSHAVIPVNFTYTTRSAKIFQKTILQEADIYTLKDVRGNDRRIEKLTQGRPVKELVGVLENLFELASNLQVESSDECSYMIQANLNLNAAELSPKEYDLKNTENINEVLDIRLVKACYYGLGLQTNNIFRISLVNALDVSQNSSDNIQDYYRIYLIDSNRSEKKLYQQFPIYELTNFQFKHVEAFFNEQVMNIKCRLENMGEKSASIHRGILAKSH